MNLRRNRLLEVIHSFLIRYVLHKKKSGYGHIGKNSFVHTPSICGYGQKNIFLGDNVNIDWNSVLYCDSAKFVMKDNSGAAVGLTVVTGNHVDPATKRTEFDNINDNLQGKDIVVEEEVWIAANVTLLAGARIGRGAIVGAGSVVRNCKIPPYSIAMGNPVKVVGFKWSVEEILEHEKKYYNEEDRLNVELIQKNYRKFFLERHKEIKQIIKL